MSIPQPRRGEVWLARLDKVRPVIVMTRNPIAQMLHSFVGVPVTSMVRGLSTEVSVGPADGIRHASVANLDNLQLVERARLLRRVGRARPATLEAVCDAVRIAIGCDEMTSEVRSAREGRAEESVPAQPDRGEADPS